jgi:hypothetical protein
LDQHARFVRLGDKAKLVIHAPTTPTLTHGDDLNHTIHPITSTAALKTYLR